MPAGLRRFFVLAFSALLLMWLGAQANQMLTRFGIGIWLGGLVVAFPALRAGLREGLAFAFVAGLCFDAVAPVPFGMHAAMFAVVHTLIFHLRQRLPCAELLVGVAAAMFANLSFMLMLGIAHTGDWPDPAAGWLRWFTDLILSQLVIVLVTPWYFSFQLHTLEFFDACWREQPRGLR
ncbi:hypothetical protein Ga0100231_011430 [Opitutaceae bacterium TAV4]|nr:hypothetical protein Ga0100231_011430 [Opitutaceae bacterium TAV4]RRJ99083.1 hypothetical protein Ga0100230_012590 [Opitutaceae bacterium TAV3]